MTSSRTDADVGLPNDKKTNVQMRTTLQNSTGIQLRCISDAELSNFFYSFTLVDRSLFSKNSFGNQNTIVELIVKN